MVRMGIHTEVPDPSQPDKTHAWISVEKDGATKTYSLYDNENIRAHDNGQSQGWDGSGTHVRENVDLDKTPTTSRFKEISPDEEKKLSQSLGQSEKFGTLHNNCSHFASRTWENTTGEALSNKHDATGSDGKALKVSSPVGLEASIKASETEQSSQSVSAQSKPEPNWKAEFRQRNAESKIPDPPPPPPPDTQSQSKSRSR